MTKSLVNKAVNRRIIIIRILTFYSKIEIGGKNMANMSDLIAEFIDGVFGDDSEVQLSRNDLANYFSVAPSQINYVLSTRFSLDKGYVIESKRGGGGFITLIRLTGDRSTLIKCVYDEVDKIEHLSQNRTENYIARLIREDVISSREGEIMKSALSDKSLNLPVKFSDNLRKNIFKEMLVHLMKECE